MLLQKKVNPNYIPMGNLPMLHITMIFCHPKMCALLLKYGASANLTKYQKNICKTSPLLFALEQSIYGMAKLLIKHKANVNEKLENGTDLLYTCAGKGKEDLFSLLHDHGAKIDFNMSRDGKTILYHAIEKGSVLILCCCWDRFEEFKDSFKNLMKDAVQRGDHKMLMKLVDKGCGVVLRYLFNNALDINMPVKCPDSDCDQTSTFLHNAVEYKKLLLIETLIDCGAKIDAYDHNGSAALTRAMKNACNMECDEDGEVKKGEEIKMEIVEVFLRRGSGKDWRYRKANRPLHGAILEDNKEMLDLLLRHDVDPDCQDKAGMTALFLAAKNRMFDILVEYGGNINHADETRGTLVDFINSGAIKSPYSRDGKKIVLECLQRNVVKLKTAGLHVSETYLDLKCEDVPKQFQEKCAAEIAVMKEKCVGNSALTQFNLLIFPLTKLFPYMEDKQLRTDFKPVDLNMSVYGDMVRIKFNKAKRRWQLMNEFHVELCSIFASLPDTCVYNVISFLTNQELRRLTSLARAVSCRKP